MTSSVLGIDLGTTNSVVASIDDSGAIVIIRNADGEDTTPSAVYFESAGEVVVGDEAKRLTTIDPDNGVTLIKRHMGTDFPLNIRGQAHTPESISALILRQLVATAGSARRLGRHHRPSLLRRARAGGDGSGWAHRRRRCHRAR